MPLNKLLLLATLLLPCPDGFSRQDGGGDRDGGDPKTASEKEPAPLFSAGKSGASRLDIVDGFPIAVLDGTGEEIGAAYGALVKKPLELLWRNYLEPAALAGGGLPRLIEASLEMDSHIPARFQEEMRALAAATGMEYPAVLASNAFPDVYRKGGCSTFAAAGSATREGKPLLARNLDFFGLGVLQRTTLIAVFKPKGYKAFVSVTWPGLSGVLSGMNADGLCCAVMEVREGGVTADGMPSTFLFRRVLEEAAGVEEALAILKAARKVAGNNLMLLDSEGNAAVAEIGPERFEVRRPENGLLFSTNDHRAGKEKAPRCRRYARCKALAEERAGRIDIESLKKLLVDVDQGIITVQSMIFEPADLRIRLATGSVPASKAAYRTLEFEELLKD